MHTYIYICEENGKWKESTEEARSKVKWEKWLVTCVRERLIQDSNADPPAASLFRDN